MSFGSTGLHGHWPAFIEAESGFTKIFLRKKAIVVILIPFILSSAGFRVADQSLIFGTLTERCVFGTES